MIKPVHISMRRKYRIAGKPFMSFYVLLCLYVRISLYPELVTVTKEVKNISLCFQFHSQNEHSRV